MAGRGDGRADQTIKSSHLSMGKLIEQLIEQETKEACRHKSKLVSFFSALSCSLSLFARLNSSSAGPKDVLVKQPIGRARSS